MNKNPFDRGCRRVVSPLCHGGGSMAAVDVVIVVVVIQIEIYKASWLSSWLELLLEGATMVVVALMAIGSPFVVVEVPRPGL